MRILPVALYAYYKKIDEKEIIKLANDISSLTHAHEISKLGCYIYIRYIMYLLEGYTKIEAYDLIQKINYDSYSRESLEKYNRILKENIKKIPLDDISSRGYVVDTLEASLWCLLVHDNYEDTILEAINLGNDTDTVAAITGLIAKENVIATIGTLAAAVVAGFVAPGEGSEAIEGMLAVEALIDATGITVPALLSFIAKVDEE